MTRTVFCKKFQKELPGLEKAPFPGPKGADIFEHVSAEAWQQWQAHQTRLINEKQLSMMEPTARKYLQEQQDKFLSGHDFDEVEGYVPKK
jgi:Fe-S cluster biosynthesis and repair protein YggX